MSTTSKSGRNSLPGLWEQAVKLWRDLVLGFGHPEDLMRWGWMRALYHRALGRELRDLEKIVRRAIRTDAEELDLPPLKPLAARAKRPLPSSNEDMPRFRRSYSDDCRTWKVSFRTSPSPRGQHVSPRKTKKPSEQRPCRTFALRIEALRRAINHRADYVRRYALRLARIEEARLRVMAEYTAEYIAERQAERQTLPPVLDAATDQGASSVLAPPNAKHIEPG